MKALSTRFLMPYKKDSKGMLKPNLPYLDYTKKQSGVYLIKDDKTGKVVYIGYSEGNLYKTIFRHFEKWTDISRTEQTRFTYKKEGITIRVIFTTPARAALLEKYLIVKMQPKDNSKKYANYLSASETKQGSEIIENLTIYTGEDKNFPF